MRSRAPRRILPALAAAVALVLGMAALPGSADANPFKDFGRAVKKGAKEVGHAVKDGARGVKRTFKGGAGTRSGVKAGGRRHGGGGHHGGRHRRR
jgi:hypothetical protein